MGNQKPAADHIRHAVSIDERRAKFKPALYAQTHSEESSKNIADNHYGRL